MRKLSHSAVYRWAVVLALITVLFAPAAFAEKKTFHLVWSIYVGWMPWDYMNQKGILKKWADKYGIAIDVTQMDYIESINQYTAGKFDACPMTNMDMLTIPAASGVDSTALIVGDFSNGNDGVVLKGKGKTLSDIKGQHVNLVELSVSHYLLARALRSVGLAERDITLVNTSDADIVAAFGSADVTAVTTWNPQLGEILQSPEATLVFDSSKIPGEIIDVLAVKTEVLKAHPEFGKALVGAWWETIKVMMQENEAGKAARAFMAEASGTDLAGYEAQLKTTKMFSAAEAVAFARSAELIETMDLVRNFSFAHGLLGEGAKSADAVGMEFPDGKILGDKSNIKMRFDASFAEMASKGL